MKKRPKLTKQFCSTCDKQLMETEILVGCSKCFTNDMKALKPTLQNQYGSWYEWNGYEVEEYHPVTSTGNPVYKWHGYTFVSWYLLFNFIRSKEKKSEKIELQKIEKTLPTQKTLF